MKYQLIIKDPDNPNWTYDDQLNHVEEVSTRITDILMKPRTPYNKLQITIERK